MAVKLKNVGKLCFLSVALILFFCSCQKTSRDTKESVVKMPRLAKTIREYRPSLIDSSLVFVVESGATSAYLMNKAGEKVYNWNFDLALGADIELLPNGQLLGMFKAPNPSYTFGGGYGGVIRIINPDSSVDWEFEFVSDDVLAHHDLELLPNGNILFLAWERIDSLRAKKAGVLSSKDIFPEMLVEIDTSTKEKVWEWKSWDHIIQEEVSDIANYGVIAENPHKININYALQDDGDIMHANGIDYDEANDVVFVSMNFFSEVWVIDHSTTTAGAAGESAGNFHRGGDLVYRFGNPEAYNNTKGVRLFDRLHFPNILGQNEQDGLSLLIYENGLKAKRSTVYELQIPLPFELKVNADNEPRIAWSFTDSLLSYGRISGADRLQNGNTLICEGDYGFWEVTPNGEIAWKYNGSGATFWRGYGHYKSEPALSFLRAVQ